MCVHGGSPANVRLGRVTVAKHHYHGVVGLHEPLEPGGSRQQSQRPPGVIGGASLLSNVPAMESVGERGESRSTELGHPV